MERPTRKASSAQRGQRAIVPVTDKQLSAFLSTREGQNVFVRRLAETLRQAWARIDELKRPVVVASDQEKQDWQTCERILVVTDIDGGVEIFKEPWVVMNLVVVQPWEDRDEVCAALSAEWKRLDWPTKGTLIYPPFRDHLGKVNLDRVLESWHRQTVLEEARTILEARAPS